MGTLCYLLLCAAQSDAQNKLSQEQAELVQLKKYEQNNPPKMSMPVPGPEEKRAVVWSPFNAFGNFVGNQ